MEGESTFDINEYLDLIGSYLADIYKSEDEEYVKGEVLVFIGVVDSRGREKLLSIPTSTISPRFKENVCDEAMDMLLNDDRIRLDDRQEDT